MEKSRSAVSVHVMFLAAVSSLALLPSPGLQAQEANGGLTYTLGLSQSLTATDNLGYAATSPGTTLRATTDLSFGVLSQTRNTSLGLTATFALRGVKGPGRDLQTDVTDPRFSLRYSHNSAGSRLTAFASYTQADVAYLDPLTDFRDELGEIVFTPDFVDLSGVGTRQSLSYGASLSLRDDRPFGMTFGVNVSDLNYVDSTTPALIDTTTTSLSAAARMDIDPTLQANLGLTQQRFEIAGGADSTTLTLDAGLVYTRPTGSFGLEFSATDTRQGTRLTLGLSHQFKLANDTTLAANIGVTRSAVDGDISTTGSLRYSRPLRLGALNARISRSFADDASNGEEVHTSLSLGATHALSPITELALNASFARVEETTSGDVSDIASLGATVSYNLTPEWELLAGYTYSYRDSADTPRGNSSNLSLTLNREFTFRP